MADLPSLPPQPPRADPERLTDPFRLAAVTGTGLLDGADSPALDRVARVTAAAVGAPVALVSLVDDRGQHFPGLVGLAGWAAERRGTPLTHSLCQHVAATAAPLIIDDAAEHPLARGTPAHRDLGVGAYLGVPLTTAAGDTVGALCAIEPAARPWTTADVDALRELAGLAMAEIARFEAERALQATEARLTAAEERLGRALAAGALGLWEWDPVADRAELGPECDALLGVTRRVRVDTFGEFVALVHPDDRVCVRAAMDDALGGRGPFEARFRVAGPGGTARELRAEATVQRDARGRPVRVAGVVRAAGDAGAAG